MTRVLHLLGSAADEQTRQIHNLLVREIGPGFASSTRIVGAGGGYRNLPTAVLQLRHEKPDLTYAWGTIALAAAVLARHRRILFSPDRFAGPRALRWIRPLLDRANVMMICPTFTQQRLAISKGIAPDRCQVIHPGVDFGAVRSRRDPALRAALGFDENDFVLIAPGESTAVAGHEHAVWTTLILQEIDPSYRLLLWGRGSHAQAMTAMPRRLKMNHLVTLGEQTLGRPVLFEELLGVADACLATPAGVSPTLPVTSAMAAGVPIISTVTCITAEMLEDRHTALMVPTRSPRALVQRVLDLRADAAVSAAITGNARAEAYEHFSMTRMLDRYRRLLEH